MIIYNKFLPKMHVSSMIEFLKSYLLEVTIYTVQDQINNI